ncbi:hypothetical protein G6F64_015275 [Rhizopus arrhizus]|uniref:Uncharacterized protein n=1 Tax=Rhizopus oryzae TaxID=64495 RepID=A0A9P7BII5_RHIOR|nr:hypothetical protein G6F64_015275 [Rhizopus arrhizus]
MQPPAAERRHDDDTFIVEDVAPLEPAPRASAHAAGTALALAAGGRSGAAAGTAERAGRPRAPGRRRRQPCMAGPPVRRSPLQPAALA